MTISKKIELQIKESSWIRKMFEEGIQLKKELGSENVYDFSLGNPILEPPQEFFQALQNFLSLKKKGVHRYMTNLGWVEVREKIAHHLQENWKIPFTSNHIALSVGAAGAISTSLKVLLDPGDEVMVFAPFFPEYRYYIDSHQGIMKVVPCDDQFDLDLLAIEKNWSPKIKVLMINSPNNPTGRMYSKEKLKALGELLEKKSKEMNRSIYLISDEPYRSLIYTKEPFAPPICSYKNTISLTSFSKALSVAGERIGYLAIHPEMEDGERFMEATKLAMRSLGFVNAPSLMQNILPHLLNATVDTHFYRKNCQMLVDSLQASGYQFPVPEGGFYLFPKAPTQDEVAFVQFLKEKYQILTVPGRGFGWPGCFRISFSVNREVIQKSLPKFQEAFQNFQKLARKELASGK